MNNTIEVRKNKIQKYTSVILVGITALVVSPIIFFVVKGIIGLTLAAIMGLALVTFTPVVSMKFANWRVRAIIAEAGENPIETLTNLLLAKKVAFNAFESSVIEAVTARQDFANKCSQFSKQYPHRALEFNKQLESMTIVVDRMKVALQDAKLSLMEGDNKLTEMRAYWDMSQAAQAANKAAGMNTGDLYEKLKLDTAVDAVFESMNKAFAQLEVASLLDTPSTELAYTEQRLLPSQLFTSHKDRVSV